jgi:ferric enterobactin receptor
MVSGRRNKVSGTVILFFSLLTFFFVREQKAAGQYRLYAFNSPGNECYFQYICFTADSDYASVKKPFIFIMGRESEPAEMLFEKDTLRKQLQFSNYKFVYIPNPGINQKRKLQCIPALASLLTNSFKYGHTNLFFSIEDENIIQQDIDENMLYNIFTNIRLAIMDTLSEAQNLASSDVMSSFKETAVQYDPVVKDETATFYVEKSKEDIESEESDIAPAKTFFGPPENYNFTLTGKITDKITGEALPFSYIQVKGTIVGTTTNNDGFFTLVKVPTDTSTLVVQYVGYGTTEVFLTPASPKNELIIEIRPSIKTLQGVTITAQKEEFVMAKKETVNAVKITPRKLEQLPGVGERDIMRSFQLMPGVSASNESSSGLYVRGGTPDQNLVLYDGFTVYHVDHLYGFFSAFNSNALKDVQLFKGGFESKFGGRLSSVTELTSKEGNQKRFNVGGDLSLLSANLYTEGPLGKNLTGFLAFRRSYQGPIYDYISNKFGKGSQTRSAAPMGPGPGGRFTQNANIKSYFYDLNGKLTWHPDNDNIISLSIYNGTDKLDNGFSADNPSFGQRNANFSMSSTDLTRYGNIGSSLKWGRKWNPKLYGNTILSYSNYYSNRDRSQERTIFNEDLEAVTTRTGVFENNDLKDYSLKSDYQFDMFNFSKLQFGVFGTWFDIKYNYAQSDTASILDRSDLGLLAGGYIQDEFKLMKDKLRIIPGLRSSYYEVTGRYYAEPRLSGSYSISDNLTLKAATGKYYQFANRVTREDIMSGSKDFWILADGNYVPVSSSVHFTAGLSYETPVYLISTELYYKKISNLTEHSLRINASPMGVNYNENFLAGNGYSKGIEFLVQKKYGDLTGWVSYTIGEAMNHFDDYSEDYFPANQDVRHEFKIVGLYNLRRFDFSANWIFATGRPYTAPSGAYSIDLLGGSSQDFFTVTSKNCLRLPDYHRLDIAATYKLLAGLRGQKRRREIGYIGFSIFNVYNHLNTWYKQFTIEEGEIIETNINYLGITPNITLSLKLR